MRTQISTNVSDRTRWQADELINHFGYSLRDVITVAIDRFYREEVKFMSLGTYSTEKEAKAAARDHEQKYHGGEHTIAVEVTDDGQYIIYCNEC